MKCSDCAEHIKAGEEFQRIIDDQILHQCIHCFLKDLEDTKNQIGTAFTEAGI